MSWLPLVIAPLVVDIIRNAADGDDDNNDHAQEMRQRDQEKEEREREIRRLKEEINASNKAKSIEQINAEKRRQKKLSADQNAKHQKQMDRIQSENRKQREQHERMRHEQEKQRKEDKIRYKRALDEQMRQQKKMERQLYQIQKDSEDQKRQFEEREKKIKQQLDKKIEKLKAENIHNQQQYEAKMHKIQQINDKKMRELESKRQKDLQNYKQQMDELAKKNEANIQQLKSDELRNKSIQSKELIAAQITTYKSKKKETKHIFNEYKQEKTQILVEERRLKTVFSVERDPNVLNIVLLGVTGNGKSTLACRLVGDISEKCDSGMFKHNAGAYSVTQGIKKQICKNKWEYPISVTDTPGIFDSGRNDRYHANNLIEFLKGCGGVNAFLLVKSKIPPRFDASFQNVLETLQVLLGREFWKYCIVVITHQNSADSRSNEFKKYGNDFRDLIRKQVNLSDYEGDLPIIGIDSFENYKRPIKELIKLIPKERFNCDELRSPLQELKIKSDNTKNEFKANKSELDSMKLAIQKTNEQYKNVNKRLSELDKSHRFYDLDLSEIQEEKGEWDSKIQLPDDNYNVETDEKHEPQFISNENENDDEWSEIDVKTNTYEVMKMDEDDDVSVTVIGGFVFKLDKNHVQYEEFLRKIQEADDEDVDCFITVKERHLKNNLGETKSESVIIQVVKGE